MTVYGYFGTMAETALKYMRDFSKFPIIIRAADLKPLDACHALRMSLSEDVRAMIPPLNVIKDESKRQNQIVEIHHISEVSSSLFLTMKGP